MLYTSILITILFSAFFSGMEMAFISANRVRLELDKQNGGLTARALNYFYSHSEKFISTMLVGNNIALIVKEGHGCKWIKLRHITSQHIVGKLPEE